MKVSKRLQSVMKDKHITAEKLSEAIGKTKATVNTTFYKDRTTTKSGMTFSNVETYAEALGCEIVIRDKETGKEY